MHQVLGTILALIKGSDLINLIKKNGLLYNPQSTKRAATPLNDQYPCSRANVQDSPLSDKTKLVQRNTEIRKLLDTINPLINSFDWLNTPSSTKDKYLNHLQVLAKSVLATEYSPPKISLHNALLPPGRPKSNLIIDF